MEKLLNLKWMELTHTLILNMWQYASKVKTIKLGHIYYNINNNQVLIPQYWCWLWIINKLVKINHMYFFFIIVFYLESLLCYLTTVNINLSFYFLFRSINLNQHILSQCCIFSPLAQKSQTTILHIFINRSYFYLLANFLSLY